MKELFRTNLYIADSDSVNTNYEINSYIRKFKSGLLMAKSIGMNPNMIFDSNGFETIINDETVRHFFVKKILESQENNFNYSIKIHIFNNFIEKDYFNNSNENAFERYYNEKIDNNYFFSSFQQNKNNLINNNLKIKQRLELLDDFSKYIFTKTNQNIFEINNNEFPILRDSIFSRIKQTIKNIKNIENFDYVNQLQYLKLLTTFNDILLHNINFTNRSHFYSILEYDDIKKSFPHTMINQFKEDIIDIVYNSSFIKKGEIFRFKSVNNIDKIYETIFDSYVNEGKISKLMNLYKTFDNIKSKLEILELITNPTKIVDYLTDKLMNTAEDKGISMAHNIASYIIPKTRLIGVSNSENLLIGIK